MLANKTLALKIVAYCSLPHSLLLYVLPFFKCFEQDKLVLFLCYPSSLCVKLPHHSKLCLKKLSITLLPLIAHLLLWLFFFFFFCSLYYYLKLFMCLMCTIPHYRFKNLFQGCTCIFSNNAWHKVDCTCIFQNNAWHKVDTQLKN